MARKMTRRKMTRRTARRTGRTGRRINKMSPYNMFFFEKLWREKHVKVFRLSFFRRLIL